jgi:transcriptional regulator GlxA family with amidase domain
LLSFQGAHLNAIETCIQDRELINWIPTFSQSGRTIASVCSGSILLAEAGILTDKKATTHPFAYDYMGKNYPDIEVVRDVRFVDNGQVITSGGVSAGIDMSLHLVGKLMGEDASRTTAATLVYPYVMNSI